MLSFVRRRREVKDLLAPLIEKSARFEWRARISAGAFAEIEACNDAEHGQLVAVKRLRRALRHRPDAVSCLLGEALILAALDHATIPRLLDVFVLGGRPCLALPFHRGQSLAARLAGSASPAGARHLPVTEALALFTGLARALAHAHGRGIAHLDVKPDNLLVGPGNEVTLVDWASACVFAPERVPGDPGGVLPPGLKVRDTRAPAFGEILGTPAYMSPEQTRWPRAMLDASSDVFSAGVVLYEMLTGTRPFETATHAETLERVRSHRPPALRRVAPDVPGAVSALVDRMLAKDSAARPRDATEVLGAL